MLMELMLLVVHPSDESTQCIIDLSVCVYVYYLSPLLFFFEGMCHSSYTRESSCLVSCFVGACLLANQVWIKSG